MKPSQPFVLTVRQMLLVFLNLCLVNWSSHWITLSVQTRGEQAAFKPVAPPTQVAGGTTRRKRQPSKAAEEVALSLC